MSFWKAVSGIFRGDKGTSVDPDEIFLDATNLPEFDVSQFEGRMEKPIAKQMFFVVGLLLVVAGITIVGRLWYLQVDQGHVYAAQSETNRLGHSLLFAERGVIYDRNGEELAWNVPNEDKRYARRAYTDTKGFGHVLGYIQDPQADAQGNFFRTDTLGLAGIEKVQNTLLAGENGLQIIETDAIGQILSESTVNPPSDGQNVSLTVDGRLQSKMYELIESLAEEYEYQGGAGILIDVESGELITLTSYPEYDPEIISAGEENDVIAEYITSEQKPFLNRAVTGLYPPGSTIKPFVALGALNEEVIDPRKNILSTGALRLPNPYVPGTFTIFPDWKEHGYVDMRKALAVSSNVYMFHISGGFEDQKGIGIEGVERYARRFGIGLMTGLSLEDEPDGVIPNPGWKQEVFEEDWRLGDTYNTSIGQYGFLVTPLQMARAVAALANGGEVVKPRLVTSETEEKRIIDIPDEHFRVIREGMELAVDDGTAGGLDVSYVDVAAKTGSAQAGSNKEFLNSWAVGYFPAEKPKYAFAVLMERGPAENTIGGIFVMRQFLDYIHAEAPEYLSN